MPSSAAPPPAPCPRRMVSSSRRPLGCRRLTARPPGLFGGARSEAEAPKRTRRRGYMLCQRSRQDDAAPQPQRRPSRSRHGPAEVQPCV